MPRRRAVDLTALDAIMQQAERVLTHAALTDAGLALSTVTHRIGPRGPWQRLLPGVVLAHRGTPTLRERVLGALAFAGPGSVITGLAALHAHGLRAVANTHVDVLVPQHRQRKGFGYVRVERTRRLPDPQLMRGVPYAPVARAVVDACRRLESLDEVREIVAEAVQRRRCTPGELAAEVSASARQRTALSRAVVAEIAAGVRSVAEARAREIYRRRGLPQPAWNVRLVNAAGELIAEPDGYWEEQAAALQIDSMAWHLRPSDYRRTQRRQRALTVHGILVLPVAPADILDDEEGFVRQTRMLLEEGARREPPGGVFIARRAG